jgi:hypothetical protein
LVVDADAVVVFPVALQGFETMRRWKPKVGQHGRRDYTLEPHTGSALQVGWQATNRPSVKDTFSIPVFESLHWHALTRQDNNVNG